MKSKSYGGCLASLIACCLLFFFLSAENQYDIWRANDHLVNLPTFVEKVFDDLISLLSAFNEGVNVMRTYRVMITKHEIINLELKIDFRLKINNKINNLIKRHSLCSPSSVKSP